MPPIKFTVHAPPPDLEQLFDQADTEISAETSLALYEAVAAQPGMTLGAAVEFALQQYVVSAQHFQQPQP